MPGGFGVRGIEGKLGAVRYARTRGIPTLGLCLGLQCMVIEAARSLAGLEDANSTRVRPERTPHPVISTMADQLDVVAGERDMGGTMRLGAYPAVLGPRARSSRRPTARARSPSGTGTATRSTTPTATGSNEAGLVFGGTSPDGTLVEFVELPRETRTRSSSARRPTRS